MEILPYLPAVKTVGKNDCVKVRPSVETHSIDTFLVHLIKNSSKDPWRLSACVFLALVLPVSQRRHAFTGAGGSTSRLVSLAGERYRQDCD